MGEIGVLVAVGLLVIIYGWPFMTRGKQKRDHRGIRFRALVSIGLPVLIVVVLLAHARGV